MWRIDWKPTKVKSRGMLGRSITFQVILFVIAVYATFCSNEGVDIRSDTPCIVTRRTHISLSWQFRPWSPARRPRYSSGECWGVWGVQWFFDESLGSPLQVCAPVDGALDRFEHFEYHRVPRSSYELPRSTQWASEILLLSTRAEG